MNPANKTTVRASVDELRALAARALMNAGVTKASATAAARALLIAEAGGNRGHGLRRVAAYSAAVCSGKVDGQARVRARKVAAAFWEIDASGGLAYRALELAADKLIQTAPHTGIAAAAVRRSHHGGEMGLWTEKIASANLIGLAFSNSPPALAFAGGRRALLGTNPIAFSAPRESGHPLTADLSLSKIARGKIMAAAQAGESIPADLALDKQGRPTTNAKAALAGALLPMGGAKGAALALMVEILCAPLIGANLSKDASSFFDDKGAPPHIGQLLIAIAIPRRDFAARLENLLTALSEEKQTRLPGARRLASRKAAQKDGLTIPARLYRQIRRLAA